MSLQAYLEADKERFLAAVANAPTTEIAAREAEEELGRVLYASGDTDASEREREMAYHLIRTAKAAAAFVDSGGETLIREVRTVGGSGGQARVGRRPWLIPAVIGGGATAAAVIYGIAAAGIVHALPLLLLALAGSGFSLLAGLAAGRGGIRKLDGGAGKIGKSILTRRSVPALPGSAAELETAVLPDADKIYRNLLATTAVIDKCLEEIRSGERAESRRESGASEERMDKELLDLCGNLLESAYAARDRAGDEGSKSAEDAESARAVISQIGFYLHRQQVELIDYTLERAAWFDRMPADRECTIRPALVSDGKLLRKGTAGVKFGA